jgi:hypothetical protein
MKLFITQFPPAPLHPHSLPYSPISLASYSSLGVRDQVTHAFYLHANHRTVLVYDRQINISAKHVLNNMF